ncbi:MAG: sulfatase-like hydrolase/transferase [Paludibacteraceae bacterium]
MKIKKSITGKNTLIRKKLLFSGGLVSTFALGLTANAENTEKPNILFIVVDDMGYSDLGCYGGEINTPNLNALATNGLRFTQFYNSARSCPSRASLLTGLYAQQVGITAMGRSLTNNCVTIPEVLKETGYRTAMAGKWHLSLTQARQNHEEQMLWLSNQQQYGEFAPINTYPSNRGFENHWGTIWGVGNFFDPFSLVHNETPITDIPDDFYYTDYITDKAVESITSFSEDNAPFFMYVAYTAPHWPLHAKPEDIAKYKGKYDDGWDALRVTRYNKMVELGLIDPAKTPISNNESNRKWENETNKSLQSSNMEVHAAMVDCVDQGVGKIIDKLRATGQLDNTIIFFMSDNGASPENYNIGDFDRPDRTRDGQALVHNSPTPGGENTWNYLGSGWAGAVNTPYRYWKVESFHGGTATPMIVHWPDGLKTNPGSIISQPGHFIDLMPTCIELADAQYPATYKGNTITPLAAEGKSLMPIFNNESSDESRILFWEHENGKAVRDGNWKLVALRNAGWQLFNLAEDLSETNNVAVENPEIVKDLKAKWNEWAKKVGLNVPVEIPDTETSLEFYYPFDDNLNDISTNNRILTPSNSGYAFTDGVYGKSLSLNGASQYLDLNQNEIIQTSTNQSTVCMWINDESDAIPTSGAVENGNFFRDEILLAQKDNNGTGRIYLYTRLETPQSEGSTSYYFNNFLGGRQNLSSSGLFERNKWIHIAAVCDPVNKNVTYYVNGIKDKTITSLAFEACQGGFRIGAHKAGKDYWNGKIDELYFFKGLLSASDINKVMNNTYLSSTALPSNTGNNKIQILYEAENNTLSTKSQEKIKNIALFSTTGSKIRVSNNDKLSTKGISKGVYIVKVTDLQKKTFSQKVLIN